MPASLGTSGATLSGCDSYRYALWRCWSMIDPWVLFIMLNPSRADAHTDDATLRRCTGYAKSWGYGGLYVGNLFALRSTDPKALYTHPDPVGPKCDHYLEVLLRFDVDRVVCAWGASPTLGRTDVLKGLMQKCTRAPYCLGTTKSNQPLHPLRLRGDLLPYPYSWSPEAHG